jgi:hypothetical protein
MEAVPQTDVVAMQLQFRRRWRCSGQLAWYKKKERRRERCARLWGRRHAKERKGGVDATANHFKGGVAAGKRREA